MASLTPSRARAAPAATARRLAETLPWLGLTGAALTVAVGAGIRAEGGDLGVGFPPFTMYWGPQVNGLVVVTVAAIVSALALAPAIVERVRSPAFVAGGLYLLAVVLGLAVNVAHDGTRGWWAVFATGRGGSVEGSYEYLPGLPLLNDGAGWYLSHFASLFPYLPVHAQGNPPGPLIALHLLGIHSAGGLAALCIGLGALSAPLAYDLGRTLGGERRGRAAGVLTSFTPSILLFGITSADYAFASLGMVVACLLVRRPVWALVAGGCAAALATFFSWLLFAIPVWTAIVVLRRDGWRPAARVALAAGVAVVALDGALAIALGYDPLSAVSATAHAYAAEPIHALRSYAFWTFGSPTAWAVMLGPAITWLALRALSTGDGAAIGVWALVAVATLLGLTRGETERIWLPFAPLACVAAAAALPARRLVLVLVSLVAQTLCVELLFFTVW